MPKSKASLGEVWKVAFSLSVVGRNWLSVSRRTTDKYGGGGEDATRSADKRKQMDGDNPKGVRTQKGEGRQEWNEQKLPKMLLGYSGRRLPGRSTKNQVEKKRRKRGECRERHVRHEVVQEVVAGIEKKKRQRHR